MIYQAKTLMGAKKVIFSTGRYLDPVLNGCTYVTSKGNHLPSNCMCCVVGIRKVCRGRRSWEFESHRPWNSCAFFWRKTTLAALTGQCSRPTLVPSSLAVKESSANPEDLTGWKLEVSGDLRKAYKSLYNHRGYRNPFKINRRCMKTRVEHI